ncbi:hypothetical protein [Streptomyces sp. XH2]
MDTSSWLCPNRPFGHRWTTRPFPEIQTPHCAYCGTPKNDTA